MSRTALFWNERYRGDDFVYGTAPNRFLSDNLHLIKGPVLSLSEGEGRHAVFLARHGLSVLGVDISAVALAKAKRLAISQGVQIQTELADLADFIPLPEHYQTVISVWAHLPSNVRAVLYPRVKKALKRNGLIIMLGYSEKQPQYRSGGPQEPDLLLSLDKVRAEWDDFEPLLLEEREQQVIEGTGHTGLASVIRFIGRKKA